MTKQPSFEETKCNAAARKTLKRRQCRMCKVVFFICLGVSLALIIGGFFVPPMGVIDGSVLTAVGELIVFPALAFGMRAVELGYDLKLSHGDTALHISNDNDDNNE